MPSESPNIEAYKLAWDPGLVSVETAMARVGGNIDGVAKDHREQMLAMGLTSESFVLDIGCGPLRGASGVLDLLLPYHYFGIDISALLLHYGHEFAVEHNWMVSLTTRSDFNGHRAFGRKFDVVWAASVLTHLFDEDVVPFLTGLYESTGWVHGGKCRFSFWPQPESAVDISSGKIRVRRYKLSWLESIANGLGGTLIKVRGGGKSQTWIDMERIKGG